MAGPYLGTLGDLLRGGYRLWLTCQAAVGPRGSKVCMHAKQMDLDALVVARGEGFTVQALVDMARCEKCGAKGKAVPASYAVETERMRPG